MSNCTVFAAREALNMTPTSVYISTAKGQLRTRSTPQTARCSGTARNSAVPAIVWMPRRPPRPQHYEASGPPSCRASGKAAAQPEQRRPDPPERMIPPSGTGGRTGESAGFVGGQSSNPGARPRPTPAKVDLSAEIHRQLTQAGLGSGRGLWTGARPY